MQPKPLQTSILDLLPQLLELFASSIPAPRRTKRLSPFPPTPMPQAQPSRPVLLHKSIPLALERF